MTITEEQRAELRKLASAADGSGNTDRGDWPSSMTVATYSSCFTDEDSRFVASISPETIISLLDALDDAERSREWLTSMLESAQAESTASIVRSEKAERERDEARAGIARIASTVFEPVTLPDGMPPLVDRIVGAIEQICRERTDAMSGEYTAIVEVERLRSMVPDERTIVVIDGAVSIAARRGDCRQLDVASVANWMAVVDAAKKEETHR